MTLAKLRLLILTAMAACSVQAALILLQVMQ